MEEVSNRSSSMHGLKSMSSYRKEATDSMAAFCHTENLDEALSILSEEMECFNLLLNPLNIDETESVDSLKFVCIALTNACWGLIHKYRSLMKASNQASDIHHKTANDNSSLVNHVKRLKDDLERKKHQLCESQERERRLKVKCDSLSRDFKHEKDEAIKLRKQIQSKDIQHAHEIRRLQQNINKLRDQVQKSVGIYVPKDKALQNIQSEHDRQLDMYQQTIRRLEDNNRQLLSENTNLRDALSLHAGAINLQAEASGIWHDVDL